MHFDIKVFLLFHKSGNFEQNFEYGKRYTNISYKQTTIIKHNPKLILYHIEKVWVKKAISKLFDITLEV